MSNAHLYVHMAHAIGAYHNCISDNYWNEEWAERWLDRLDLMLKELPHGSGLDTTWTIDFDKSSGEKIVLGISYHHMDAHGGYTHWSDLKITITPSLQFGYTVACRGTDLITRSYLEEILTEALSKRFPITRFDSENHPNKKV